MKIYNFPSKEAEKRLSTIINRGLGYKRKDFLEVTRILDEVKKNGDRALVEYIRRFDAPDITVNTLKTTEKEMKNAASLTDRSFKQALGRAVSQITSFHQKQLKTSWIDTNRPGTLLGQLINPVGSVGIYVPGGRGGNTPLVSSVLMCGIPARIAGVKKVVMVTPPNSKGGVNPHLLVAARKVGIRDVYKVGSAWGIAALAFGTETVPKVDMIAGPGNIHVSMAKKIVADLVGIDLIAGPSEILIIADRTANPEFIAADLLSQAEHDPLASALLVTDSPEIGSAVALAIRLQLKNLLRKEIIQKSLSRYGGILVVPDLDTAVEISNRIAPEHLELHIKDPFDCIGQIRNAGAVFAGDYTPESVGDYIAGPNHVLPTAGTARFASGLSVDHFIKKTNILHYSRYAFNQEAKAIIRLAEIEGLDAHAHSIRVRFKNHRDNRKLL
ncbi:MAG: histidinol dehydrogenase [Desulfobacterales bacterium]